MWKKKIWKPLFSAESCNFLFFSTVYGYSHSVKTCFTHSILYWVCLYWVCFNKEQGLAFSNLVSPKGCHSFPSHPLWLALHLSPNVWMKRAWGSQYVHTHKHTHTQFDGMSDQLKRKNGALHRYGENLFSGIFVCGTHDFSWDHTSTFTKAIVMLNLL